MPWCGGFVSDQTEVYLKVSASERNLKTVADKVKTVNDEMKELVDTLSKARKESESFGKELEGLTNDELLDFEESLRKKIEETKKLGKSTDELSSTLKRAYDVRTTGVDRYAEGARAATAASQQLNRSNEVLTKQMMRVQESARGVSDMFHGLAQGGIPGVIRAGQGLVSLFKGIAASTVGLVGLPALVFGGAGVYGLSEQSAKIEREINRIMKASTDAASVYKARSIELEQQRVRETKEAIQNLDTLIDRYRTLSQMMGRSTATNTALKGAQRDLELAQAGTPEAREAVRQRWALNAIEDDRLSAGLRVSNGNQELTRLRALADGERSRIANAQATIDGTPLVVAGLGARTDASAMEIRKRAQAEAENAKKVIAEATETIARLTAQQESISNEVADAQVAIKVAELRAQTEIAESSRKAAEEGKERQKKLDEEAKKINAELDRKRASELQEQAQLRALAVSGRLSSINNNPFLTERQKRELRYSNLQEEAAGLPGLMDSTRSSMDAAAAAGNQQEATFFRGQLLDQQKRSMTLPGEMAGARPLGMFEEVQVKMVELQNSFMTIADGISGVMQSAIGGIAKSIEGLLTKTMTWGDALRNIGSTILQSVIQAISRLFAEWVTGMVLKATIGKALQSAALAASIPMAMATSALWAAPATLATIATFGGAAAQAPLAIAASKGAVMASSFAGFEEGGYTPMGPSSKLVGGVHAGEWVAPKWMRENPVTQSYISALESVRVSGNVDDLRVPVSSAETAAGGATMEGSGGVNVAFFQDEAAAMRWLGTRKGKRILYRQLGENRADLGIPT